MCYYNGIKVSRDEYIHLVNLEKEVKAIMSLLAKPLQSGFEYTDWPIVKPVFGGKDIEVAMALGVYSPVERDMAGRC